MSCIFKEKKFFRARHITSFKLKFPHYFLILHVTFLFYMNYVINHAFFHMLTLNIVFAFSRNVLPWMSSYSKRYAHVHFTTNIHKCVQRNNNLFMLLRYMYYINIFRWMLQAVILALRQNT